MLGRREYVIMGLFALEFACRVEDRKVYTLRYKRVLGCKECYDCGAARSGVGMPCGRLIGLWSLE